MTLKHRKTERDHMFVGDRLMRKLPQTEIDRFYMHVAKVRAGIPIEPKRAEHFDNWKPRMSINGEMKFVPEE